MSGTAYNWGRWLNGPLPFYDDPATQQATQQTLGGYPTMQDTGVTPGEAGWIAPTMRDTGGTLGGAGWSGPGTDVPYSAPSTTGNTLGGLWSAPSTQVPYTAPSTAPSSLFPTTTPGKGGSRFTGPFGTPYNAPSADWNPWSLYDGGEGYKGGDGIYNVAADTKKGWGPNGQGEFDRDRVWRMTLEDLKAKGIDPGSADLKAVQAAFLTNVARLHRDYRDTPGLGEQAWADSAFAGYDKYQAGGGGTPAAPATVPQAPTLAGAAQALGDATKTGGKTVDPDNGTGLPIPGSTTTTPIPMGPLNSIGGQKLANSPELAWRYLVQQMGGDADYEGPFSNYMQSNFAPALAAMINARLAGAGRAPGATGLAGMDQVGKSIGEFGGMLGGNDLFTKLGGIGSQGLAAGGGLLNQASSQDAGNFVRQMLGLTGMGNGPLAQSAQQYLTNKMMNDYTMSAIGSKTGESPLGKFGTYLGNNGFLDKLRQFGLLQ